KVVASAPHLGIAAPPVAITWFVVACFVVIGWALLVAGVPPANGWACILVAAATIPGDLNDIHYTSSYLSPVGYLLEPLYLPAAVALVMRYPAPRLTPTVRRLVVALIAVSCGSRALTGLTQGTLPDGFQRPPHWADLPLPAWWHDWVFLRAGRTV